MKESDHCFKAFVPVQQGHCNIRNTIVIVLPPLLQRWHEYLFKQSASAIVTMLCNTSDSLVTVMHPLLHNVPLFHYDLNNASNIADAIYCACILFLRVEHGFP
jgi:hypothetical protein